MVLQADDTLLYVTDPDQSGADSFEFTMSTSEEMGPPHRLDL